MPPHGRLSKYTIIVNVNTNFTATAPHLKTINPSFASLTTQSMHKLWMSGSVRPYVTYYSSKFNVPYKATYVPIIYSVVIQLNSNKTKPFESYFSHSVRAVRLPTHIEHPPQMDMWIAILYKFNPHQIYVTHTFSPTALYVGSYILSFPTTTIL